MTGFFSQHLDPKQVELFERIAEKQNEFMNRVEPILMNATDASSKLGINPYFFNRLVDEQHIPFVTIGSRKFYETQAVLDGLSEKLNELKTVIKGGETHGKE